MINFQLGDEVFTLTGMHLAYVGMVIVGIAGLFGAWKGKKWFSRKKEAKFVNAMKTIAADVLQGIGEQTVRHMTEAVTYNVRPAIQGIANDAINALDDMTNKSTKVLRAGLEQVVPTVPAPANDPGFNKPHAMPSKIGDLFELEKVMGRFKLWAEVKERTTDCIDVQSARLAPPSTFDRIKQSLGWQTYGPNADQPLTPVRLIECDTNHLENILATQTHLTPLYHHVITAILRDRYRAGARMNEKYLNKRRNYGV